MAQEIQTVRDRERVGGESAEQITPLLLSKLEPASSSRAAEDAAIRVLRAPGAILSALGDESSKRILISAIAIGKTVEEISAEQNLPLSTCYRRVRRLLARELMILERSVVTPAGKRYALYRTTFTRATIRFDNGAITVEVTPNLDVLDKLHRRWLSANYAPQRWDELSSNKGSPRPNLIGETNNPFE